MGATGRGAHVGDDKQAIAPLLHCQRRLEMRLEPDLAGGTLPDCEIGGVGRALRERGRSAEAEFRRRLADWGGCAIGADAVAASVEALRWRLTCPPPCVPGGPPGGPILKGAVPRTGLLS